MAKKEAEGAAAPRVPLADDVCPICRREFWSLLALAAGARDLCQRHTTIGGGEAECFRRGYQRLAGLCSDAIADAKAGKPVDPDKMIDRAGFEAWKP